MFGACSSVSSRSVASWPAMNESNTCGSSAKTGASAPSRSDRWTWHELPSRSSNLAMNEIAMPSWSAISFAPFL